MQRLCQRISERNTVKHIIIASSSRTGARSSSSTSSTAVSSTKRLRVILPCGAPAGCVKVGNIIERQREEQQRAATERETAQRERQKRCVESEQHAKRRTLDITTSREEMRQQRLERETTAKKKVEQKAFANVIGRTVCLHESSHGVVMRRAVDGRQQKAPGRKMRLYKVLALVVVESVDGIVDGTCVPNEPSFPEFANLHTTQINR